MSQNMDAGERPLELKPIIGLVGVLIAALTVGLNDQVTAIAMNDIRGGLGISSDPGAGLTSLYATGQVIGMGICTWIAVTVTIRRFALFAFALCGAATVLCACTGNLTLLLVLRFLQGMGGGFIIPLLLTSGIRLLGPQIRLFGLAAYALTATFAPNISTTVAALWVDVVGWRFAFFQDLPLFAVAGVLAGYGLPQDSPRYERLKQFDWRGVVLVIILAFALVTVLEQGDRLDWFNSNLICVLSLTSVITVPLLVVNEIFHPLPLFRPQLLKRRNFAYAIIALFLFLLFVQSSSTVPAAILTQVQGFRPSQIYPITLGVGMAQLALLPLMAILLNITWVDARIVSFIGLSCMLAACIGDSFVTSSVQTGFFYVWQALQTLGEPMVIMALLMISTN